MSTECRGGDWWRLLCPACDKVGESVPVELAAKRRWHDQRRMNSFLRDFLYLSPIILLALLQLRTDPGSQIVYYVGSVSALFLLAVWMMRHLLVPGADLARTWRVAHDSPIGAAIVLAALCYLLAQVYSSSLSLFH
jgi:hypothetical protein